MILRIFYTDKYRRQQLGKQTGTFGLRQRLAKQYGVSFHVIKRITSMKHNRYHNGKRKNRDRFPRIALQSIQKSVLKRIKGDHHDV